MTCSIIHASMHTVSTRIKDSTKTILQQNCHWHLTA